ncbi:MAG: hypothetical protein R3B45_05770 [Bdellovibrionota bacterium]
MKLTKLKTFLWTATLALGVACGENSSNDNDGSSESTSSVTGSGGTQSSGVADSNVELSIQGTLPSQTLALQGSGIEVFAVDGSLAGTISLTEARIVLEEIRLKLLTGAEESAERALALQGDDSAATSDSDASEAENAGDDDSSDDDGVDHPKFKGPYVVDLLNNVITPAPESIIIPEGLYRRVELRVHKMTGDEAAQLELSDSDPLIGNSIYVAGSYTPAGEAAKEFKMTFDLSEDFELRSKDGFSISNQTVNDFLIAFRLAEWFRFDNIETNSDGVSLNDITDLAINLNKDSDEASKNVREVIKENIKLSAEVGKDEDGDGKLGDSEDGDGSDDDDDSDDSEDV